MAAAWKNADHEESSTLAIGDALTVNAYRCEQRQTFVVDADCLLSGHPLTSTSLHEAKREALSLLHQKAAAIAHDLRMALTVR